MGADLFESYVGAIIGSMVLGIAWMQAGNVGNNPVLLPLFIAAAGIVISILCTFFVKTKEGGNPQTALDTGTFAAAGIMLVVSWFLITTFLGEGTYKVHGSDEGFDAVGVFFAVLGGLVAGTLIGIVTEYYTSDHKPPVQSIAKESLTGPATNIISGLGVGMWSTALPTILICAAILTAYKFAGLYGVAMAALGMLCTTGIQLAVDAYGPIADNAGGIAEMAHLDPEVRNRTDKLDAVGNTTAAIGKGFAIGSAALTALALFAAYAQKVGLLDKGINVMNPEVMVGVFMGGMLPFVFSAMAMNAVGRAAGQMIEEVRRQFREIPGLREGKEGVIAEHAKCVQISTDAAIKEMVLPGLMAIVAPVIAGFYSVETLGGLLVGTTVGGVMMAIFMSNAGGAWDNAKKYVEGGNICTFCGKINDPYGSK
jgi:K(+)-stimulated pyrophosphate-energized sodium pump